MNRSDDEMVLFRLKKNDPEFMFQIAAELNILSASNPYINLSS
ncbi:MAG: hypothetical protein RLN62_07145 [Rickettsiales bacterium]